MRIRTFMRALRKERGFPHLEDAARVTGLVRGELSYFERGHAIPRDDQVPRLIAVYGPVDGWWPPTVRRAILGDLRDCAGCGEELDPDASGAHRYHDDDCRAQARRNGGDHAA